MLSIKRAAAYIADRLLPHFRPVDFVATTICAILATQRSGLVMNHVINPHLEDGISLDTIVDWTLTGGVHINRIADHAEWFCKFSAQLKELNPHQRQFSAQPIVSMWSKPLGAEAGSRCVPPENAVGAHAAAIYSWITARPFQSVLHLEHTGPGSCPLPYTG